MSIFKKNKNSENIELKSERIFSDKYLLKLLGPLFVEQMLVYAIGIMDSVMVSSVGEAAVSAVSLVDSVMVLLVTIMTAIATGGAVVIGQFLGQQKMENANKAAQQLIIFATLFSVVIIALMYIFKDPFISLVFGDIEADVLKYCNTYYIIVIASVPFIAIYNSGAAIFRSVGNSKIGMNISALMNVINISGNALLIFVFHRGVEGVAIPTLAARIVAAAVMLKLLREPHRKVHIEKNESLKPELSYIKKILKIGIPNGIENGMFQLGKLLLLSMISGFGTVSIAANAVGNTVAVVAIIPGMAMGYGVLSVISVCVGAGDYNQVRFYVRKLLRWVYIASGVLNIIMMVVAPVIIDLYGLSDETGALALQIIIVNGIGSVLIWPLSFTVPTILRASGDVTYTMIIGVASMWVFRIFFGMLLGKYAGLGVLGVWIAMVVDWAVRSICFCLRYKSGRWKHSAIT